MADGHIPFKMNSNNPTMPTEVIEMGSTEQFNTYLHDFPESLIIVTFYTTTCPICKAFKPSFEAVQQEFMEERVIFGRADANQLSTIAQQLGIMGVPHTLFIKNKEIIHRMSGNYPKPQFRTVVNDILKRFFNIKRKSSESFDSMYM